MPYKMTRKIITGICLFLIGIIHIQAQEILRPLQHNHQLTETKTTHSTKQEFTGPLLLPFLDDFSYQGPFPDNSLWMDKYVFINTSFAKFPRTVGTATFDALDQYGNLYAGDDERYQFSADMLTSRPIRLDSVFSPAPLAFSPSDSIMLSFYYQPQGIGSAPRPKDSLVVEFLHTPSYFDAESNSQTEDVWVSVWHAEGESLSAFLNKNDSNYFKRVVIPITDEVYFRDDFQFRFRNYGSFPLTKTPDNYAGNTSIWNVDYVSLNYGKTSADSFDYDIAFVSPAQSALKDYQAMPWSHYITNPEKWHRTTFNNLITNLDDITYNYLYRYFIRDENGNIIRNYSGGTWNIAPFSRLGYQTKIEHSNPILVSNPFGINLQPAEAREFQIVHVITEGNDGDDNRRNDTVSFRQVFDNYFAYDDGIPENGYGLIGFNPMGAVRFVLGHSDNLDAVQFYFNRTLNDQNVQPFILKIWKNLDPEILLYESEILTVDFGQWLNEFVTYKLDQPLEVSDTIYVGWQQLSDNFLNIGFDANNNAGAHFFFNSVGVWQPTIFSGALMIRPLFGPQQIVHTGELEETEPMGVYPNPLRSGILTLQKPLNLNSNFEIVIFDSSGKTAAIFHNQTQLDLSGLTDGMYFLQVKTRDGIPIKPTRFIIAR
jgi:hypothetical protein